MNNDRSYLSRSDEFPRLLALIAKADECVANGRTADLTSECRSAFDHLLTSDELTMVVIESLESVASGDLLHPVWLSKTAEEWVVVDTKDYSLRLVARKPRNTALLQSLNFNCLIGNLSGPEFGIVVYECPSGTPLDDFKVGLKTKECRRIAMPERHSCELLADNDIPHVQMKVPVLTLTLYPKVYSPLIWCFDRDTLTSVMAMGSHDSPVRRQAGAELLRYIHQAESISVHESLQTLARLATDEAHFVRWSAIQALCAIDLDFARPYLLKAEVDPHPGVAAAARRAVSTHLI